MSASNKPTPKSHIYIAALLWAAGLLASFTPIEVYQGQSILAAIMLCSFAAFFVLAGAKKFDFKSALKRPVFLLAGAFWGVVLVSVFASEVPFISFIYFCVFSLLPLSFFATYFGFRSVLKLLICVLAVLLVILSLSALWQYFIFMDWLVFELVAWPLSNPNAMGALFSLGFVMSVAGMLGGQSRAASNAALVLAILSGCALLTTGSRGAFLALLMVLPILLFFVRGLVVKHRRCLSILVVVLAGAFVGFGMAGQSKDVKAPVTLVAEAFEPENAALSDRPAIWASALEMFQDHLWTGTGIGTFFLYYPEYREGDVSTAGFTAHNDPLQYAVETGVFGVVLFYALMVAVLIVTVRAVNQFATDDVKRIAVLGPACALAALGIHSHVSFPFQVAPLLMLIGFLLGLLMIRIDEGEVFDVAPTSRLQVGVQGAFCVVLFLGLAVFSQFQYSNVLVTRAQQLLAIDDGEGFASALNEAGDLSHNLNPRALLAAAEISVGQMQFNGLMSDIDERQAIYDRGMALLNQAEVANPREPLVHYYRAELKSYAVRIAKDAPPLEEDLRKALEINPLHLRSRMMLAQRLKKAGDKAAALAVLEEGLYWPYHNISPHVYYERVKALAKDLGRDDLLVEVERQKSKAEMSERAQ